MTLPRFTDQEEQSRVLGPLYTSDMKAQIPIFGPEKYMDSRTRRLLTINLGKIINTNFDTVVDHLAIQQLSLDLPKKKRMSLEGSNHGMKRPASEKKSIIRRPKSVAQPKPSKTLSSRELHDFYHYASQVEPKLSKAEGEQRDHVMLKRAVDGYLFATEVNEKLCGNDKWLEGVWEWIAGIFNHTETVIIVS